MQVVDYPRLAALVAVGVEVADDVLGLFGYFEEVLFLGDLLVLAVAVLDPLLPFLLLPPHRQNALALDLKYIRSRFTESSGNETEKSDGQLYGLI